MAIKTKSGGSQMSYHAIGIVAGLGSCPAALKLSRTRFLSIETPALPLPKCTSKGRCLCTYQHFMDRRAALRRVTDRGGLPTPWTGKPERRMNPCGRRAADQRAVTPPTPLPVASRQNAADTASA